MKAETLEAHTSPIAHLVPDDTQDRWLDKTARRRSVIRRLWHGYINYPRRWTKKFLRFLHTTPGKMTAMVLLLSIFTLSAGLSMSNIAADRRLDFDRLINNTEPVSYMAHNLYTSLSSANTAASSGFVLAGTDSEAARADYFTAFQEAGHAIALTAGGISIDDTQELALITELSQKLPIYTGLVETAWANNRQGNPVGVAYMSEASTLMREELLPLAARLYTLTSENVEKQQQSLTEPLWLPISGLAAALIALVLAQIWMSATTNRRFNKGMLLAFALMAIATTWVVTANAITWQAGSKAYEKASAPLENLTDARILAQQARTQEMLALVWRQSLESSGTTFATATSSIKETLATFNHPTAREAETALTTWANSHNDILAALNVGDYETAQSLALKSETAQAYEDLDTALATLIDENRTIMRAYLDQGVTASTFVSTMVLLISIISVLSLWIGIRPRLQEYL